MSVGYVFTVCVFLCVYISWSSSLPWRWSVGRITSTVPIHIHYASRAHWSAFTLTHSHTHSHRDRETERETTRPDRRTHRQTEGRTYTRHNKGSIDVRVDLSTKLTVTYCCDGVYVQLVMRRNNRTANTTINRNRVNVSMTDAEWKYMNDNGISYDCGDWRRVWWIEAWIQ